jgi:transposase
MEIWSYLLGLPNHLQLKPQQTNFLADHITFTIASTQALAPCPVCHASASRIHSHYERTLADLPWGEYAVSWKLQVRKFFCPNSDCHRCIFTERLPGVVLPWARKTKRLMEYLTALALALGGAAGARLSHRLGLSTSRHTLLRLVGRTPLPTMATPTVLGVDDWAYRKGRTYGTVLVDLENRQAVALLSDREAGTLAAWLKTHPGVEVISRDRSTAYRQGATQGAPAAIQVADRFHLLHNLAEVLQRVFDAHLPVFKRVEARADQGSPMVLESIPPPAPEPDDMQRAQQTRAKRLQAYQQVQHLRAQGWKQTTIAQHLGLGERTIRRYLSSPSFPERRERKDRGHSGLDPHKAYVLKRWNDGCRQGKVLLQEMRERGFRSSYGSLARYLRCLKEAQGSNPGTIQAQRFRLTARSATWLVLRRPEKRIREEDEQLAWLRSQDPALEEAVGLAEDFARLVRGGHPEELDDWLRRAVGSSLTAFVRFVGGLREDYEAVKAGVTLPWSNGQVEGQVNRLKTLKRQMYGRAGIALLSKRFLLAV